MARPMPRQVPRRKIKNGTERMFGNTLRVYYDGYWIRSYHLNNDSYADKKMMIDQLTRRVFHHLEPGINTPSHRLDEIREVYEAEEDPTRKRVKGAMLAGALLNRGRHILTVVVELEEAGVKMDSSNPLLRECGQCFMEALSLGKNIRLADGGEGVDELWGEPFKAFSMPIEDYFSTSYIKIAQTMVEIDTVAEHTLNIIEQFDVYQGMKAKMTELADFTKEACETIRNDPSIFEVWPRYIAAKDNYQECLQHVLENNDRNTYAPGLDQYRSVLEAYRMIEDGGKILSKLATLRVPLPKSVGKYCQRCEEFLKTCQ